MPQYRKTIFAKNIFILLLFFLFAVQKIESIESNNLNNFVTTSEIDTKFIGKYVEIFKDPSAKLSIKDILSDKNIIFEKSQSEIPGFGITDAAYWLKTKIRNTYKNQHWIFELSLANINYVELYIKTQAGEIRHMKAGQVVPAHDLDLEFNQPAFPVTIPQNQIVELFFYIHDPGLASFP